MVGDGWGAGWGGTLALSAQHGGVAWEFDARNVTRYQSNTKAI